MNISVNEEILQKYNLSVDEFLVLYLCAKEVDIKETIRQLILRDIVDRDLTTDSAAVVSNNTKEIISAVLIESDKAVIHKDSEYDALAEKMRNLYPEGKKPGTTYYWRDSVPIIARKLKTLVVKFGVKLTEEEVLDATKRYVEAHHNDMDYMQLLKYFILKADRATGELRSELLSYLNNKDTNTEEDWTTSLV